MWRNQIGKRDRAHDWPTVTADSCRVHTISSTTLPLFHFSLLYIIHSHHTSFSLPTISTASQLIYKTIMCWLQSNRPPPPSFSHLSLLQKTAFGKQNDAAALSWQRAPQNVPLHRQQLFLFDGWNVRQVFCSLVSFVMHVWMINMGNMSTYTQSALCLAASHPSLSHSIHLVVWDRGHPFLCVPLLVQHQWKGRHTVVHSQG